MTMTVSLRSPSASRPPNAPANGEFGSRHELLSAPVMRKFFAVGSAGGKVSGGAVCGGTAAGAVSPGCTDTGTAPTVPSPGVDPAELSEVPAVSSEAGPPAPATGI